MSRRAFLCGLTLAGTTGLLGVRPGPVVAEPPPETTQLRLLKKTGRICWAPQYIAEDLLRAEGFTDVTYVDFPGGAVAESLGAAKADLSLHFVGPNLIRLDGGTPWCSSRACTEGASRSSPRSGCDGSAT